MYKIVVMSAVAAVGIIEVLKKFLPSKMVGNEKLMTVLSVVISSVVGYFGIFVYKMVFNYDVVITQQMPIILAVATAAFAQINYPILVKVPKSVYKKLENKTSLDEEKISEEIANSITGVVETAVKDALEISKKG